MSHSRESLPGESDPIGKCMQEVSLSVFEGTSSLSQFTKRQLPPNVAQHLAIRRPLWGQVF